MNIKALIEKRAALLEEAQGMINTCENEARALNEDESVKYAEIFEEVRKLNETIEAANKLNAVESPEVRQAEEVEVDVEKEEYRAFEAYVRGNAAEIRANNLTPATSPASGGALIPTTIANKIIAKVYDICPILEQSTKYNVKGKLQIPYYDESSTAITVAYQQEFVDIQSNVGAFTTIDLTGYLAGAMALISRSLINNAQFDIVNHIINYMAYAIKRFIEGEMIHGTSGSVAGLSGITTSVTTASATAITADEVVKLHDAVKDDFQDGAIWIMSPATRTALRLLQDVNHHYLLNDDISSPFGATLLGKPVYVSDNMDDIATGKTTIIYGNPAGLATKFNEEISIEVLRERYAPQHAVAVIAWFEFDAKVENQQAFAKLVQA